MSSAKDNNNEPGQHACEQGTFELPWQVELARKIRFGIVDQAILILSLIFGVSLEATVARRFKVPGYGIVVGGAIGNIVSDVVAAYGEDLRPIAAVGCGIGGILLMLPLGVSLALKKPLSDRRIQFGLAASTIGFAGAAYGAAFAHERRQIPEEAATALAGADHTVPAISIHSNSKGDCAQ